MHSARLGPSLVLVVSLDMFGLEGKMLRLVWEYSSAQTPLYRVKGCKPVDQSHHDGEKCSTPASPQANMVERLYTQSLEHDQRKWEKLASDLAQPLSRKFRKLASAEDEEEWIKRMFYAKTEMSAQAARKLSMKYAADPVPVLKLRDYSEIEEANDKFFYRSCR